MRKRIGILHQGRLVQEVSAKELECIRLRRLYIRVHDKEAASSKLMEEGYAVLLSEQGLLEISGAEAINNPERIAKLLVEANLESYFLRTIGMNGGSAI